MKTLWKYAALVAAFVVLPYGNLWAATTITLHNNSGVNIATVWRVDGVVQFTGSALAGANEVRSHTIFDSGKTITIKWVPGAGCSSPYTCYTNDANYGSPGSGVFSVVTSGTTGSYHFYADPYGTDPNTNMCQITICARNNDNRYRIFGLYKAGLLYDVSTYPGGIGIAAGQVGCVTIEQPCTNSAGFYLDLYPGELGFNQPATNSVIVTNGPPAYPGVTNTYTPQNPSTFNPTNSGAGVSNIVWTSSSYTNTILSQQQGDAAVYDAINKFAQGNDINLRGINSNITSLKNTSANGLNGVSNLLWLGLTNGQGFGNVTGAIRNFHFDNTNLLGQILHGITNGSGTNAMFDTNLPITASMTNYLSASTAADPLIVTVTDQVQGGRDFLSEGRGDFLSSGGSAAVFSFTFMGQTVNLDPEVRVPGAMGFVKAMITLIATLMFAQALSKLLFQATQTYASAETGGIPDMNLFGFNVVGVGAAIAVSVAFILIWMLIFGTFLGEINAQLLDYATKTAEPSLSNAGALYLFSNTIPAPLLVNYAITLAALHIGAAKLVIVAASVSRFLAGK